MLLFLTLLNFSRAKDIVISKNGTTSDYAIVIPYNENNNLEKWRWGASKSFHDAIQKITGEDLKVVMDNEPKPKKAILLGPTKYSPKISIKNAEREQDGFEIMFNDNEDLVILGTTNRGIVYGVFEVFERFGNVRWLSAKMEIFPKSKTFSIPSDVHIKSVSHMILREVYTSEVESFMENNVHLRFNEDNPEDYGGWISNFYGVESFNKIMTPQEYPINKYPEQWALIDGQRSYAQPCLTNENTFKVFLNKIMSDLDKHGERYIVEVSQNDVDSYCQCQTCNEHKAKYGGRYSGVNIEFCNRLAEEIVKKYPKVQIRTFAYYYTRSPPSNIKVHPNVMVRMAPIDIEYGHPINESTFRENTYFALQVPLWENLTKNLAVWDYVGNFGAPMGINPLYHVLAPNMRFYAEHSVKHYIGQDNSLSPRYHNDMVEYRTYLLSKLMWNPWVNDSWVRDDFCYNYYGPSAAPYIIQFLRDAEDLMRTVCNNSYLMTHHGVPRFVPAEFVDHAKWLFDRAVEASANDGNPRFTYNVEMSRVSVLISQLFMARDGGRNEPYVNGDKINFGPIPKMKEAIELILKSCPSIEMKDPYLDGVCFLTWDRRFYQIMKDMIEDRPAIIAKSDPIKAATGLNNIYGRIISLTKSGKEFLKPEGIDFVVYHKADITPHSSWNYTLKSSTANSATLQYSDNGQTVTKTMTASSSSLTVDFNYQRNAEFTRNRNFMTAAFDLGDATRTAYKLGNGEWNYHQLQNNMEFDHFGKKMDGETKLVIIDATTKKGVEITCPNDYDFFVIQVNRTSKSVKVIFVTPYIEFAQTKSFSKKFIFTPYDSYPNSPSFQQIPDSTSHDPSKPWGFAKGDRIVIPDFYLNYELTFGRIRFESDEKSFTGTSTFHSMYHEPNYYFNPNNKFNQYFNTGGNYSIRYSVKCVEGKTNNRGFSVWFPPNEEILVNPNNLVVDEYRWSAPVYQTITKESNGGLINRAPPCTETFINAMEFVVVNPPTWPKLNYPEKILGKMDPVNESDYTDSNGPNNESENNGKSTWIPGVVVLSIFIVVVIVIAVFIVLDMKKKDSNNSPDERKEVSHFSFI